MALPKVAMLTNIPSPYREEMHIKLNNKLGENYHVFYCAEIEPNRSWKFEYGNYKRSFLKKSAFTFSNKPIYFNLDIIKNLNDYNPKIVITAGFYPTVILAFLWCKLKSRKHISFTDATIQSEGKLSFAHKLIRRIIYPFSDAFIAVSKKGFNLYRSYEVNPKKLFWSPLCIHNEDYKKFVGVEKKYDILWSGQFIDMKLPFFFINVVKLVNQRIECRVNLIGSGPLRDSVIKKLEEAALNFTYPGFLQQDQLPLVYASSKLLLFPTKGDPWGVVANEACAAGVPVITCENAGAANELIINGYNGYVLPLDEKKWAEHIIVLLTDNALYNQFSENALGIVKNYNYENAVKGILDAVDFVS